MGKGSLRGSQRDTFLPFPEIHPGFGLLLIIALLALSLPFPVTVSASALSASIDSSDPHDEVQCLRCHILNKEAQTFDKGQIKYDVNALCSECHDSFCMHPVDVPADRIKMESAELVLPLVRREGDDLISCLTCHGFHGMQAERYLLKYKGNSLSDRFEGLCRACHREEEIKGMSPHSTVDSKCGLCHSEVPEDQENLSEEEYYQMQRRCDFCHGMVAQDHFRSIDPLSDPTLAKGSEEIKLVMIDGEYACFSCHDPHDTQSDRKKLLKKEYLELAAACRNINPHWKNVMCVTCHRGEPEKGNSKLRMNGDINGLCERCHNSEIAVEFLHPVGCEPSEKVNIPEDMPLLDGKITCQTCHKSSLQESGENVSVALRSNSAFLRYELFSPGEFCFKCHIKDFFSRINVHDQLTEDGEIKTRMCSGCHFVRPEDDGDPTLTTGWDVDPKEYCLMCHKRRIYTQNHPAGPHLVEPSRDTLYTLLDAEARIGAPLPLYEDRITCSTCHDPHQRGVLKSHTGIEKASGKSGMRAQYREILCTGCHDSEQ